MKSIVSDVPQGIERVMAAIKMDNDVSVTMTLFDSQAVAFHNKLEGFGDDPGVVVVTNIK